MSENVAVTEESLQTQNAKTVMSKLDALESAESTGLSLVKKYLELEKGKAKRFVVFAHGTKEDVDTDSGEVSVSPTVDLMDGDKQLHFTQSHVITQALANAQEGTAVEITYMGEKKLPNKKTLKEYSIELLNL